MHFLRSFLPSLPLLSPSLCSCNGAALVGGPDTTDLDMLGKMSHDKLESKMSGLGSVC